MTGQVLSHGFDGRSFHRTRLVDGARVKEFSDDNQTWQAAQTPGRAASLAAEAQSLRRVPEAKGSDYLAAGVPAEQSFRTARFPWWQIALASALGSAVPIAAHLLHLWGF